MANTNPQLKAETMNATPARCSARTTARFARLNKNNTMAEYREEVANGDFYREAVEVREVVNLSPADYDHFANNLLEDHEWLAGRGGHNSDYPTPSGITSFWEMTEEQQEAWRDQAYAVCTAVQCDGRPTLYVNPEGHSYARYVGI